MSDLTERIGQANGFEYGSLPANQRGEKTPEQNSLLFPKLIAPLIFIFVSLLVVYVQFSQQGILKKISVSGDLIAVFQGIPTGTKVMAGLLLAVCAWAIVILVQLVLDILDGSVRMLEGMGYRKVTTSTDDDGTKTTRLYYLIAGKKFPVKRAGFSVFEDGKKYRAYFTPRRKVLVNIEVI